MEVIATIAAITVLQVIKHRLKSRNYIDDTYNYAFAGTTVWTNKPIRNLLFDVAADASTASSPPFYPTLYHHLVERKGFSPLAIQSFFDWLAQTVIFVLVYERFAFVPAIAAVAILNLSPLIFKDTLYFTDRLWAATLLAANFWSLDRFLAAHHPAILALSVATYGLLILSHKHSFQMLLIAYAALTLAFGTWVFAATIAAGEIITYMATRGYSWEVHKGHFQLLRFGRRYLFPLDGGGYGRDQLLFLRRNAATEYDRSTVKKRLRGLIVRNWDFILYIMLLVVVITGAFSGSIQHVAGIFPILFFIIVVTAVATQAIQPLKFIGEGDRYLQYATFPAVMAAWPALVALPVGWQYGAIGFFVLWSCGTALIDCKILGATQNSQINSLDPDFEELTKHIRTLPGDNYIVFPIQKTYAFAWLTGKKILHFLGARGFWQAKGWFPQIRRRLPDFYDEYGINFVVLDQRYVKPDEIELGNVRESLRQGNWVVFEVVRPSGVETA